MEYLKDRNLHMDRAEDERFKELSENNVTAGRLGTRK